MRHGTDFKLGRFFTLVEFACKDGTDKVLVHPALMLLVNKTRAHFGRPLSINSGYRTEVHNKAIGGAENSRHVWGMAADIVIWNVTPQSVQEYLEGLNVGGLKKYDTFTHVDVQGLDRRW